MNMNEETLEREEKRMYEIGYLLAPHLADESLTGELNKIVDLINSHDGNQTSSGEPQMKELSYTIGKEIDRKRQSFDKAYFGFIKFDMAPSELLKFKVLLDANPNIIRYLLISTKAAKPLSAKKTRKLAKVNESANTEEKVSEEKIDEELDAILDSGLESNQ